MDRPIPSGEFQKSEGDGSILSGEYQRSVLVRQVPPGVTEKDLIIYFQKKRNGGGELDKVVFPYLNSGSDTALVTFEDAATVRSVTSMKHSFRDEQLRVEPLPSEIFSRVTVVISPVILPFLSPLTELTKTLKEQFRVETHTVEEKNKIIVSGKWIEIQEVRAFLDCSLMDHRGQTEGENDACLKVSTGYRGKSGVSQALNQDDEKIDKDSSSQKAPARNKCVQKNQSAMNLDAAMVALPDSSDEEDEVGRTGEGADNPDKGFKHASQETDLVIHMEKNLNIISQKGKSAEVEGYKAEDTIYYQQQSERNVGQRGEGADNPDKGSKHASHVNTMSQKGKIPEVGGYKAKDMMYHQQQYERNERSNLDQRSTVTTHKTSESVSRSAEVDKAEFVSTNAKPVGTRVTPGEITSTAMLPPITTQYADYSAKDRQNRNRIIEEIIIVNNHTYQSMISLFYSSCDAFFKDRDVDIKVVKTSRTQSELVFRSENKEKLTHVMDAFTSMYQSTVYGELTTEKITLPQHVEIPRMKKILEARTDKGATLRLEDNKIVISGLDVIVKAEKNLLIDKLRIKDIDKRKRRRFDKEPPGNPEEETPNKMFTNEGMKLLVYRHDITDLTVDVIVNAANENLHHGGGVAAAIAKAAGRHFLEDCKRYTNTHGPLKIGQVMKCDPGSIPHLKYVFNTVGPVWHKYGHNSSFKHMLHQAFRNCLVKVHEHKMKSIAIPLVSSGIFGGPKELCAQILWDAVAEFSLEYGGITKLKEIHLVNIDVETTTVITSVFQKNLTSYSKNVHHPPDAQRRYSESAAIRRADDRVEYPQESSDTHSIKRVTYPGSVASYNTEYPPLPQSTAHSERLHHSDRVSSYNKGFSPTGTSVDSHVNTRSGSVSDDVTYKRTEEKNKDKNGIGKGQDVRPKSNASWQLQDQHGGFSKQPDYSKQEKASSEESGKTEATRKEETCPICFEIPQKEKTLKCGHTFCADCIEQYDKPKCAVCGQVYGVIKGDMPTGTMIHDVKRNIHIQGYKNNGAIEIIYSFPDGIQESHHPRPGQPFKGTRRIAYLPDTPDGRRVLRLLRRAFDARLTFTVGTSRTTGATDTVTWNDIHHKTSITGGPQRFGYPDETYLKRVQEELAAHGITE